MWHYGQVSDTYVAWNGREYPWPPPAGWEQRSDGRYWPVDTSPAPQAGVSFGPQYGPASSAIYALAESLPPPSPKDRIGSRPLRRHSYIALGAGMVVALLMAQFVAVDALGFTVRQDDFVNFAPLDEPDPEPNFGEERELSEQSKRDLLETIECTNEPGQGARLVGEVANPLAEERAYQIAVQFTVDGDRQLDGFTEVVVPANASTIFNARSASPARPGSPTCAFGTVFRFRPN